MSAAPPAITKFRASLAQYETIDRGKTERFGKLVQGFFVIKRADELAIVPFQFVTEEDFQFVEKTIVECGGEFKGVSFVQNYIHYGTP